MGSVPALSRRGDDTDPRRFRQFVTVNRQFWAYMLSDTEEPRIIVHWCLSSFPMTAS